MSMALELLVFSGLFALAVGLLGSYKGASERRSMELRKAHANRRY